MHSERQLGLGHLDGEARYFSDRVEENVDVKGNNANEGNGVGIV
jgi:hypothetical protein